MKANKIIGTILRLIQEDAEITDEEITEYLDISIEEYYNILTGETGADINLLRKIDDLYGLKDYIIVKFAYDISTQVQPNHTPEEYKQMGLQSISALNQTTKYLTLAHGLNAKNGFMEIKENI